MLGLTPAEVDALERRIDDGTATPEDEATWGALVQRWQAVPRTAAEWLEANERPLSADLFRRPITARRPITTHATTRRPIARARTSRTRRVRTARGARSPGRKSDSDDADPLRVVPLAAFRRDVDAWLERSA